MKQTKIKGGFSLLWRLNIAWNALRDNILYVLMSDGNSIVTHSAFDKEGEMEVLRMLSEDAEEKWLAEDK